MPQPKCKLPKVTERNRLSMIAVGYLMFCLFYLGAPHLASRSPVTVPTLWLDTLIPFIPLAVWVYLSQFALLFCAIWYAPNTMTRSIAFYSMLLASASAALIFIAFPTILPRYPVEDYGATALLWQGLYAVDVPSNCFPSLHAALAVIAVFPLYRRGDIFKIVAPLWALAIMFAAMATKQHVVLDILGGLVLALPCLMLITRYFKKDAYDLA
ncbi:MAG: phosphatase PAP2 family protein [Burkholderiales bacterium]|nr:phosphatase PAP2 family protein [Burkholderiales bacterium]